MRLFDKFKKREQAEKEAEEIKKELDKTLNISIAGKDVGDSIKKDIYQKIDDNIVREYGTDEEISQLNKRIESEKEKKARKDKLLERYKRAKRMNDKNSIRIFHELIDESEEFPDLIIKSYHGIVMTSMHIKHCDEAIAAANKCIEFKKSINENYDWELHKIEFIKKYCRPRKN
jgi:hypothetical protein